MLDIIATDQNLNTVLFTGVNPHYEGTGGDANCYITLPNNAVAAAIVVGFPYRSQVETLSMNVDAQNGSMLGNKKRVVRCTVMVENSSEFRMMREPTADGNGYMSDYSGLNVGIDNLSSGAPYTGDVLVNNQPGWDNHGRVTFETDGPGQMKILGIIPEVDIGR